MTEPEAGSDVMSMRTRARRPWTAATLLNGVKTFITNARWPTSRWSTPCTGEPGSRSLGLFIVETTRHGITRGKKFSKMGWRGSPTGELVLDDCLVPAENLIGAEGDGRAIMLAGLNTERVVMAAECVGLSQGALDVAVAYARERRQFGRPIGDFQLIQGKLATMYAETEAIRAMVMRAAALAGRGARRRRSRCCRRPAS